MNAGRELDVLIARTITKLQNIHQAGPDDMIFTIHRDFVAAGDYWYQLDEGGYDEVPHYSTDDVAALRFAKWLYQQGHDVQIALLHDWRSPYECQVGVLAVSADTLPVAICLAALQVYGIEVQA